MTHSVHDEQGICNEWSVIIINQWDRHVVN